MKRLTAFFVLFLIFTAPLSARPLGYAEFTAATARALTDTPSVGVAMPSGTRSARICAETQNIRFREDGTNPTATVGEVLTAGQCITYLVEPLALRRFRFIETAASAKVTAHFYGD